MIHYTLTCERQHQFDGWFKAASAYDQQRQDGTLVCPVCQSGQVDKALMAPAVARSGSGKVDVAMPAAEQAEIRAMLRALRDKVVSTAENVGPNFASEARKIHYAEAPARGIYGQASADDVSDLLDEGIEFMPLPEFPDDHN